MVTDQCLAEELNFPLAGMRTDKSSGRSVIYRVVADSDCGLV